MKSYTLFQQYSWLVNIIRRYRKISLDEINKHWVNASISNGISGHHWYRVVLP